MCPPVPPWSLITSLEGLSWFVVPGASLTCLLVSNGELTGGIDFGLLGVGDPARDLMVAWTYLSAEARQVSRHALAVDDPTWARGGGWALHLGLVPAAYSADNPMLGNIGRYTIAEVLADVGQSN